MNIKYPLGFLFLCFCFPAMLVAQTGNCVVFCPNGTKFHLAIDNKFQNSAANSNVKVTGIPEGDYWVTILFDDESKKAFKTNVRILEDKEIAYALDEYNGSYKLLKHSTINKNEVKSLSTAQAIMPYHKAGVEVRGYKDANELKDHQVHSKSEITRVQGDRNDPHSKRMGNYSSASSGKNPDGTEPAAPAPKEEPKIGTFVTSKYIEMENADGTSSIVEERVTTIKDIVERNGQKQIRTKKGTTHTPTDFNCLPMEKEKFVALKKSVQAAEADQRLTLAQDGVKGQCMTPAQLKVIGDFILSDVDRNNFAIAAKSTCADPKKFPFEITEPVAVEEKVVEKEVTEVEKIIEEEKEVEEKIIEENKTEAQLKAELKALKQKEKLAKKAAKAKEKAAKAEAKRKAKEEKARLKAEAKAAKGK